MGPGRAWPVPRVAAGVWQVPEVGAQSGPIGDGVLLAIWLGSGLRRSHIMSHFSCEEFLISLSYML